MTALSRKCCGILTGLSHIRHYLPPETLPEIVNALVISHIRYCLVVYGNGSAKNQRRIQTLMNFAARVISGKRKFDHISGVRDSLRWLDPSDLSDFQTLSLLHKIRRTGQPESLAALFTANSERPDRGRETRQDHLLSLPRVRSEAGKRRFSYHAAHLHNALPPDLFTGSTKRFRRALKANMLAAADVT